MEISDLGFVNGRLCETIVTTYHPDGKPNSAPMGVYGSDGKLVLRIHEDTDTFANIMQSKCCVVNIVFDPWLFLRCALFGRGKGSSVIESKDTLKASNVHAPFLKNAHAYVQVVLTKMEKAVKLDSLGSSNAMKMVFEVKDITVLREFPSAPNRGFFAAIELAIALSRGRSIQVERLLNIIKKTLPEEESNKIEETVRSFIED